MPRLEYEITGSNAGLANAASQSIGILQNLQKTADNLKVEFFGATTQNQLNAIGGALQTVVGKINEYTNAAVKGSQAFKDQQGQAALDALATKLTILNGNAQLFGQTIQNQQAQVKAYQDAISKLLSNGFDPMDSKISALKIKVDSLTQSINAQKEASRALVNPFEKFAATGSLIRDAENKVRNLGDALRNATDSRSIALYNIRLVTAQKELASLRNIGLQTAASQEALAHSQQNVSRGFNTVSLELGRVIQDAPFAANNFGAIGNNITRLVEVFPGYISQTRAAILAQGGAATSANVLKTALGGLFTGFGAVTLGISLLVSGFVFYQQHQQSVAREAENYTDILQKQKKALDDYILTLGSASRVSAGAVDNYGDEISKLDTLFAAIQKNTKARYENGTAIDYLQSKYPDIFGSLKENEFLNIKTKESYDKLRESIIATGTAAAAQSLAAEATKNLVKSTVALSGASEKSRQEYAKYVDLQAQRVKLLKDEKNGVEGSSFALQGVTVQLNRQFKKVQELIGVQKQYQEETRVASKEIDDFNKAAIDAQTRITTPVQSGLVFDLEKEIKHLREIQPFIKDRVELEENVRLIKQKQTELDALLGKEAKTRTTQLVKQLSLAQQLQNILEKGTKSSNLAGLEGYLLEVQKIHEEYRGLNIQLDQFNQKVLLQKRLGKISAPTANALLAKSAEGRKTFANQEEKELNQARITEEERIQGEIQRIRDEFGVKAEQSRGRELALIEKKYKEEERKAKSSSALLIEIDRGRTAAIEAVNAKYLALETELQDKILAIDEGALASLTGVQERQTAKISAEWESRRRAANKYFEELKKIKASEATSDLERRNILGGINAQQSQVNLDIDRAKVAETLRFIIRDFVNAVQQGIGGLTRDIYGTLTNLNKSFDIKAQIQSLQAAQKELAAPEDILANQKQINALREQLAEQSFTNIFSNLVSKTTAAFNEIFLNLLTKKIQEAIQNSVIDSTGKQADAEVSRAAQLNAATAAGTKLHTELQAGIAGTGVALAAELQGGIAAAGASFATQFSTQGKKTAEEVGKKLKISLQTGIAAAGIAGGLVSGLTPKTSAIGQGLGGALSRAATAAAIGSIIPGVGTAVGAIAGGIVGAIGGIFGSGSERKKQEELQKQQLEEAKRQTELMRQQALAFTSSIIGRMTDQGIVTNVDVNEFGQLTAKVSGKDLKFILERNG